MEFSSKPNQSDELQEKTKHFKFGYNKDSKQRNQKG